MLMGSAYRHGSRRSAREDTQRYTHVLGRVVLMPKSWQEEVQEILDDSARRPTRPSPKVLKNIQGPTSFLDLLGRWVRRRFSTTGETLVTASVLIVLALFLSIFMRQLASILVVAGAMVFAGALVRGIFESRNNRYASRPDKGPVLWRGRVIEAPQQQGSFLHRTWNAIRRVRNR